MSLLSYRKRKLIVRHYHLRAVVVEYLHRDNLRRAERVRYELRRLVAPRYDVYLLSVKLVYYVLYPASLVPYARPHRVHFLLCGHHRHLGPVSGLSDDFLHLYYSLRYLRNFYREQLLDEFGIAPRKYYLVVLRASSNFLHKHFQPPAYARLLSGNPFLAGQKPVYPVETHYYSVARYPADDARYYLPLFVGEPVELHIAFHVADALHDKLLNRLYADSAEVAQRRGGLHKLAYLDFVVHSLRVFKRYLQRRVPHFFHDFPDAVDVEPSGVHVKFDPDRLQSFRLLLIRLNESVLDDFLNQFRRQFALAFNLPDRK